MSTRHYKIELRAMMIALGKELLKSHSNVLAGFEVLIQRVARMLKFEGLPIQLETWYNVRITEAKNLANLIQINNRIPVINIP